MGLNIVIGECVSVDAKYKYGCGKHGKGIISPDCVMCTRGNLCVKEEVKFNCAAQPIMKDGHDNGDWNGHNKNTHDFSYSGFHYVIGGTQLEKYWTQDRALQVYPGVVFITKELVREFLREYCRQYYLIKVNYKSTGQNKARYNPARCRFFRWLWKVSDWALKNRKNPGIYSW